MSALKAIVIGALFWVALLNPIARASPGVSHCISACPTQSKPVCGSYFYLDCNHYAPNCVVTSSTPRMYKKYDNKCIYNCNRKGYTKSKYRLERMSRCK
ncbi:hypothetical protein Ndes2526B_g04709 [Nannochloris sp. 'desiccata']